MLVPALLYKEEIEKKMTELMYSDDYYYYMGYGTHFPQIDLQTRDCKWMWAIVNKDKKLLGYLCYELDLATDCIRNFGLMSFDKGNPVIGKEVFDKLKELIKNYYRVEWCCVGDNPALDAYIRFCTKHKGYIHKLHSATVNTQGKLVDSFIFEILAGGE